MSKASRTIPCIGCHAQVPDLHGPMHAYIGASAGCWRIYGDVLAREYGEYAYPDFHRLTVDAYAAQHPGQPSRRSIQSVAVHLIALHLVIERGLQFRAVVPHMRTAIRKDAPFAWLDPPAQPATTNILDIATTTDLKTHERGVRQWADSVWQSWSAHHDTIRAWAGSSE